MNASLVYSRCSINAYQETTRDRGRAAPLRPTNKGIWKAGFSGLVVTVLLTNEVRGVCEKLVPKRPQARG